MPTPSDLAEVFSPPKPGPRCWRAREIPPEASSFLEQVEAHIAETGRLPYVRPLSVKLEALGFDINEQALAHHYKGRCSCPK